MTHQTLIGAIDQGTSSSRFLVFSADTYEIVTHHQLPIQLISSQPGWVEIDPYLIISTILECMEKCAENLQSLNLSPDLVKAIGVTNQRETTILWDKHTGKPLYNAVVWMDTRTRETVDNLRQQLTVGEQEYIKRTSGLPVSTYFSAVKIKWLMQNVADVKLAIDEDRCAFGDVASWILWNLIGDKSCHLTDVTNASRTMLMDLRTLKWDTSLCDLLDIPRTILPEIRSSAELYGPINQGPFSGVPIASVLGDQQAALVGHLCLHKGSAKNTYGTGCFLIYNTGNDIVSSKHGLLTTVAYKFGNEKPVYALEGSIASAGATINWLRNNLNIIEDDKDIEGIISQVKDTSGVVFVPAFSGLFAPHWRPDARALIIGLTQYTNKAHIIRAALESIAHGTSEILEAMRKDGGVTIKELEASGGMTQNKILMQMQADILGIPILKPLMAETTSFGAALAAGKAMGILDLNENSIPVKTEKFYPLISPEERLHRHKKWDQAVKKTFNWEDTIDSTTDDTDVQKPQQKSFMQLIQFSPIITILVPLASIFLYKFWNNNNN